METFSQGAWLLHVIVPTYQKPHFTKDLVHSEAIGVVFVSNLVFLFLASANLLSHFAWCSEEQTFSSVNLAYHFPWNSEENEVVFFFRGCRRRRKPLLVVFVLLLLLLHHVLRKSDGRSGHHQMRGQTSSKKIRVSASEENQTYDLGTTKCVAKLAPKNQKKWLKEINVRKDTSNAASAAQNVNIQWYCVNIIAFSGVSMHWVNKKISTQIYCRFLFVLSDASLLVQ